MVFACSVHDHTETVPVIARSALSKELKKADFDFNHSKIKWYVVVPWTGSKTYTVTVCSNCVLMVARCSKCDFWNLWKFWDRNRYSKKNWSKKILVEKKIKNFCKFAEDSKNHT